MSACDKLRPTGRKHTFPSRYGWELLSNFGKIRHNRFKRDRGIDLRFTTRSVVCLFVDGRYGPEDDDDV